MKKISNLQFELLNFGLLSIPFVYLALNWAGSAESKVRQHNSLYIFMGLVVFMYLLPTLMAYIDSRSKDAALFLPNARTMRIVSTMFGVFYSSIAFREILFNGSKFHVGGSDFFLIIAIYFVIIGNYQSRVKANSAFNGLVLHFYSDKVQIKNNRYQGRAMMIVGVILFLLFCFLPEQNFDDGVWIFNLLTILGFSSAFLFAIFSTPRKERGRRI